jgi:hypothetical protein
MRSLLLLACSALFAMAAPAQTLKSVRVEPANAAPGQSVTITTTFDVAQSMNCSVKIHFGDGQSTGARINQEKDASLVLTHAYAKPGKYTVKVEPKTDLPVMKCLGKNQTALVRVMATEPVAAPAPAGPACPEGWKLDAKSVNKRTGTFTCRARAGTAAPATKLACPGQLGYYENAKTGQLGCRP